MPERKCLLKSTGASAVQLGRNLCLWCQWNDLRMEDEMEGHKLVESIAPRLGKRRLKATKSGT